MQLASVSVQPSLAAREAAAPESPDDVAAILTWFREEPGCSVAAVPRSGHGNAEGKREPTSVSIEELQSRADAWRRLLTVSRWVALRLRLMNGMTILWAAHQTAMPDPSPTLLPQA